MTKVALSGASGNIGQVLRPALLERGVDLRSAGGRRPLDAAAPGRGRHARRPARPGRGRPAARGRRRPDPHGRHQRRAAAAGDHREQSGRPARGLRGRAPAQGQADRVRQLEPRHRHVPGRGEARARLRRSAPTASTASARCGARRMARMYWDKHGIEGISLRIGSTLPRPTEFRHLSTWLGHDDLLQLIMRCIEAPDIGYLVVWGVSNNTRSYWDQTGAERLGYRPSQNSEDYAEEILKPAEPARPDRAAVSGRRLRDPGFHATGTEAGAR